MGKHPNINIPIRVALVFIAVRLAFFFGNFNWPQFEMVYLFCVVGALIPLCIYGIWPRGKATTFPRDIASAMRIMAAYGIIVVIFTIIFYAFIDPSYFAEKQTTILKRAIEASPNKDPDKLKEGIQSFFSVRNFSALLLLGFMCVSFFYAMFFTVLKRLVIRGTEPR